MAESNIPGWIQLLVAVSVPLLAPLIAWFLGQRGITGRTKEFEALLKRTELVEKIQSLPTYKDQDNSNNRKALDAEVDDIISDFTMLREIEQPANVKTIEKHSWISRILLLYKQASVKGTI